MSIKVTYPYGYLDDWEKFNETSLPEKENFYSHLNMDNITDVSYVHANEFVKILKQKQLENIMICVFKATHYC